MTTQELHTPPLPRPKIIAIEAALENCRRLVRQLESDLASEIATAEREERERRFLPVSRAVAAACNQGFAAEIARIMLPAEPATPVAASPSAPAVAPEEAQPEQDEPALSEPALGEPATSEPLPAAPRADDLTLISGLDAHAAALLVSVGIVRYADIKAFKADDVDTVNRMLGEPRRVQRQCWIEQAAMLAVGVETAFARKRRQDLELIEAATEVPAEPEAETADLASSLAAIEAIADRALVVAAETAAPAPAPVVAMVETASPASNVVPLKAHRAPAKRRLRPVHWMTAAASIAMLAAASVATIGLRPAFAQYLHGLSCSASLNALVPACEQLTWLAD